MAVNWIRISIPITVAIADFPAQPAGLVLAGNAFPLPMALLVMMAIPPPAEIFIALAFVRVLTALLGIPV